MVFRLSCHSAPVVSKHGMAKQKHDQHLMVAEELFQQTVERRQQQAIASSTPSIDVVALLDAFHASRRSVAQRARWEPADPGMPPLTCRYCGRYWRRWAGSKLDGHAACVVTEDFKLRVGALLRSPTVTYGAVGEVIGVTPAVVRSWTFPIRSGVVTAARGLK